MRGNCCNNVIKIPTEDLEQEGDGLKDEYVFA